MRPEQTTLHDPEDGQNDYERALLAQIRSYGWRSTHVQGDEDTPSFTYSTGFWLTLGHPEILVFDFPAQLAHDVIGQVFRKAKDGHSFPLRRPTTGILADEEVTLLPVRQAAIPDYLISSHWFYKGADFPCLQLVWPDPKGLFPWQAGFDDRLSALQPDLTETGWPPD